MKFFLTTGLTAQALKTGKSSNPPPPPPPLTGPSPTTKVIELLTGLESDLQNQQSTESGTYDTFACFCKDKTLERTGDISTDKTDIDNASGALAVAVGSKKTLTREIAQLHKDVALLTKELDEAAAQRAEEEAIYDDISADLAKALSSLNRAITSLVNAGGVEPPPAPSPPVLDLLQIKSIHKTVKEALVLADVLGIKIPSKLSLFQQEPEVPEAAVDKEDYSFQSDGIVQTLGDLRIEFTNKKHKVDEEERNAVSAYNTLKLDKEGLRGTANGSIGTKGTQLDTAVSDIGDAKADLTDANLKLTDDEAYLKDLTAKCELKAREWDQRSTTIAEELTAIGTALDILQRRVAPDVDRINERALIQKRSPKQSAPRAMRGSIQEDSFSFSSFIQIEGHEPAKKAMKMLDTKSKKLQSAALAEVSASLGKNDPFKKVKNLIQNLIERLLSESAAEATQHGWCETELTKARKDFEHTKSRIFKLNSSIEKSEAKRDQLDSRLIDLEAELSELDSDKATTAGLRDTEKGQHRDLIQDAKEGLEAIQLAITTLKKFYHGKHGVGGADTATVSFVQASPVDDDAPEVHSGAYKGAQGRATNIISLLEQIRDDYKRTIEKTTAEEKEAHREFVNFDKSNAAATASATREEELKSNSHDKAVNSISTGKDELISEVSLLDGAVSRLEELNPACVDTGMSYEQRVEKRNAEISALEDAKCILDPNCEHVL